MNNYILKSDTIIAIATPLGKGGIGIIRISGTLVKEICKKFFKKLPIPRQAEFSSFTDVKNNEILDQGIIIYFKEPKSFTGEDVLEFHGHGSPIMLNYIINCIIYEFNIRMAFPGEFSSRAFLNGKLSLNQAESILDLIDSESILHAKLASKSVQGLLFKKINDLIKELKYLNILTEALINFSEDDIDNKIYNKFKKSKDNIIFNLKRLKHNYHINKIVKNGIKISIIGKPNVGKSTLFNSIINEKRSIVSSISGTTRDSVNSDIWINGICFNIIDTAGIKETNDKLEKLSIKKTIEEIGKSDHIFYIIDHKTHYNDVNSLIKDIIKDNYINKKNLNKVPFTIIKNKSDISKEKIEIINLKDYSLINISAKNNEGIDLIINHLKTFITKNNINTNCLIKNRHINYINISIDILEDSNEDLVILSKNITDVIEILSNIIGNSYNITNNVLNEIFSKFCIGK